MFGIDQFLVLKIQIEIENKSRQRHQCHQRRQHRHRRQHSQRRQRHQRHQRHQSHRKVKKKLLIVDKNYIISETLDINV